jgi:hypothetical protein
MDINTLRYFTVPSWKTVQLCQSAADEHISGRTDVWLVWQSPTKNWLVLYVHDPITPYIEQQINTFEYVVTRISTSILIANRSYDDDRLARLNRSLNLEFSAHDIVFNAARCDNRALKIGMSCLHDISGELLRKIHFYVISF